MFHVSSKREVYSCRRGDTAPKRDTIQSGHQLRIEAGSATAAHIVGPNDGRPLELVLTVSGTEIIDLTSKILKIEHLAVC